MTTKCRACAEEFDGEPITVSYRMFEYETCSSECASLISHYVTLGVEVQDGATEDVGVDD